MRPIKAIISFFLIFSGTSFALESDWPAYFEKKLQSNPNPSPTVIEAATWHEAQGRQPGLAVDLGTGTGNDALYLLNQGWHVIAMDSEPLAIQIIISRTPDELLPNLQGIVDSFETMQLPERVDLINASLSLPFCRPDDFSDAWEKITDSLVSEGVFSGHFFGNNHVWSDDPDMTFQTKEELLELFKERYEILSFNVVDKDLQIVNGSTVHWHQFSVVAKKL